MFLHGIFHVLFKPFDAFREIAERPTYHGPGLIILAIIAVSTANVYVNALKVYVEVPTPENDEWTESTANLSWRWTSNGVLLTDLDSVRGNYSIQSSYTNATRTLVSLSGIGPLSCSKGGYDRLSFRIKWVHKDGRPPTSNATVHLVSGDENVYFLSSISANISRNSNEWANITMSIGPESEGWTPIGSPQWASITGVQFRLDWAPTDAGELKVKIDDLFFGGEYGLLVEGEAFSLLLFAYLTNTLLNLLISWFTLAIILFAFLRITGFKSATWKPLFITAGYTLSVLIVQYALNALLVGTLPALYFPFEALNPVTGEEEAANQVTSQIYGENWFSTWQFQTSAFLFYAFNAWAAMLVVVALHFLYEMDWKRAIPIAVTSYLIAFLLKGFISPL